MIRTQVLKHFPDAGRAREEGVKKISGEERLPVERCRRVGMSGSLRGRRSEEMTSRILPPHVGRTYLLSHRGDDDNRSPPE